MTKIIIIGAGIAGLAAANYLQKDFPVTILEARHRYGGRISVENKWGITLSKGAHWIHDAKNNPMMELAKKFSSPIVPFQLDHSFTFTPEGLRIPLEIIEKFNYQFEEALTKAKDFALGEFKDCSLSSALFRFLPVDASNKYYNILLERKLKFFENYMGANCKDLSARYWDIGQSFSNENYIVVDGFAAIINGLAKHCDIKFNSSVKAVHLKKNIIEIITENQSYYADKVIVTLPLGVLKNNSVLFTPSLSQIKQQAIKRLGMGLFNIIALLFPSKFWPDSSSFIHIANSNKKTCTTFINMEPIFKKPILYGYVGGDTAHYLENVPAKMIVDEMMQTLRSAFGQSIPFPEQNNITSWGTDPFAYGSYSYTAVDAIADDFIALSEPCENRLFFAGEATNAHLYDATTHGAYLSGIREAKRIINL